MNIAKLQKKINRVQIALEAVVPVYVIALAPADVHRVASVVVLLALVVLDLAEDAEEAALENALVDAVEDVKKAAAENVKANVKTDARELPKEIVIIAIIVAKTAVIRVVQLVLINAVAVAPVNAIRPVLLNALLAAAAVVLVNVIRLVSELVLGLV